MLYTSVKRRGGTSLPCEIHLIGNGVIELRNFYKNHKPGNIVRYTPKAPITAEHIVVFLNDVISSVKNGILKDDYRFHVEKVLNP